MVGESGAIEPDKGEPRKDKMALEHRKFLLIEVAAR